MPHCCGSQQRFPCLSNESHGQLAGNSDRRVEQHFQEDGGESCIFHPAKRVKISVEQENGSNTSIIPKNTNLS